MWAEIWPEIGPRIEHVIGPRRGDLGRVVTIVPQRSGYTEETYHTFSYSPLTDEAERIAGMLCVVSEETERVVGERRMATLRELGSDSTAVRTEDDVLRVVVPSPRRQPQDPALQLAVYLHER